MNFIKTLSIFTLLLISPLLSPLLSSQSFAVETVTQTEINKKVVTQFYDMAFNQHQPKKAAQLYIGNKYIQHNPLVPNGALPFYSYFEGHFKLNPESKAIIHRVAADGDLVYLHVESKLNDKDLGRAIVDIFRLENGKIVEHWDVIQAIPASTANGNTMFNGSNSK